MHANVCPRCGGKAIYLAESSKNATVDYHRCERCGHVWSRDKDNPKSPARDVTIRSDKKA